MNKKIVLLGIILFYTAFFILPIPSFAQQSAVKIEKSLPIITTSDADSTATSTARLAGSFEENTAKLSTWFEWGTTSDLGKSTTPTDQMGETDDFMTILTGLSPGTIYYFRADGKNANGTTKGQIYSFATSLIDGTNAFINYTKVKNSNASQIDESSVKLSSHIDPNNTETTYWFEWGADPKFLINSTPVQTLGSKDPADVSISLTDLPKDSIFYFRTTAQNKYGIVRGDVVRSWTTSKISKVKNEAMAFEIHEPMRTILIMLASIMIFCSAIFLIIFKIRTKKQK